MDLIFEQIMTGGDRNFGYLIADRGAKEALLIDPSYDPEKLIERSRLQGCEVTQVINTHGHHDHTNGNEAVKSKTGARLGLYHSSNVEKDFGLKEGDTLKVGSIALSVMYTPGHIDDHMILYSAQFGFAITGDHLFVGKVGRTLTEEDARQQWEGLQRMFKELPETTTVWPGHNYGCRPSSTLLLERASNPFIQAVNFEKFLELKEGWATFKSEQGLA